MREASIAVELILKAILCVKNKKAPPAKHDVYELWSEAGLKKLDDDDMYRLVLMTEILYWSGRYAAPRFDSALDKSEARFKKYERTRKLGTLQVKELISFGWAEFDSIYQIANRTFWELDPNDPKNFVA